MLVEVFFESEVRQSDCGGLGFDYYEPKATFHQRLFGDYSGWIEFSVTQLDGECVL
jgi:hypothetical protein